MQNEKNDISIDEIKVMININPEKEYFELTSNMLYHPKLKPNVELNKYPFICPNFVYPPITLFLIAQKGYTEIVHFFFNKKIFKQQMQQLVRKGFYKNSKKINFPQGNDPLQKQLEKKEKELLNSNNKLKLQKEIYKIKEKIKENIENFKYKKYSNDNNILNKNIHLMLKLLFPTTFPARFNISDSFTELIQNQSPPLEFNYDYNLESFSYLKIDGGEPITITKVMWLNDLINHPLYNKLITLFANQEKDIKKQQIFLDNKILNEWQFIQKQFQNNRLNIVYVKKPFEEYLKTLETQMQNDNKESMRFDYTKILKDNITQIIEQIKKFEILQQTFLLNNIADFFMVLSNIKTLYEEILKSNIVIINIPADLNSKIDKAYNHFKKIFVWNKIKTEYLKTGNIIIDLEGEDKAIADEFLKKEQGFGKNTFLSSKIKEFMLPERECNNYILQKMINDYAENKNSDEVYSDVDNLKKEIERLNNEIIKFKDLNNKTKEDQENAVKNVAQKELLENHLKEMNEIKRKQNENQEEKPEFSILLKAIYNEINKTKNVLNNYFSNTEIFKNLYIGACNINTVKYDIPKYEIYLAIDSIYGEYDNNTIDSVKCINESEYLVKKIHSFSNSPYDINNNRTIITAEDLKHNKIVKKTTKRGGCNSRKKRIFKKKKRITQKKAK